MKNFIISLSFSALLLIAHGSAFADEKSDAEGYVKDSVKTLTNFTNDPEMAWFRSHIKTAKGILIIPMLLKAGFVFGGSGGTGVFLRHSNENRWGSPEMSQWSYPAFYTMGAVSWGFQIGAEAAEVVLMIMTDKGIDAMLSTKLQLGADISVAAGPVGAGAQAATVDILQFARTKGVFGGLTLEGSVITPRASLNDAYYGRAVSPLDILIRGDARNPQAYALRAQLLRLSQ